MSRPWSLRRRAALIIATAGLSACGRDAVEPEMVLRSERVWVDASRPTPPTSHFPGAAQRTLRTLIWRPAVGTPLPLVLLAHGFGGLPEKFDAFARTIAAAGFVVAATAFPLTNENAPGGHDVGLRDFPNQPADVSFIISQLLDANSTPSDTLAGHIAAEDIAALGHSLGGLTVIGLTRKACCRDPRVRASILVAAVAGLADAFGTDPITMGPPTLIIHGTADTSVPYISSEQLYDMIEPPRFLVGLTGAGHSDALESQIEPAIAARDDAQRASIAFLNAVFQGALGSLNDTLAALALRGDAVQSDETGL